ncbi:hypothetical protein LCGC14_3091570, partial [marine sediment metagenome]
RTDHGSGPGDAATRGNEERVRNPRRVDSLGVVVDHVRITSDGTPKGTKVTNSNTGEEIPNVRSVRWSFGVGELSVASIETINAEGDVEAEQVDAIEFDVGQLQLKDGDIVIARCPHQLSLEMIQRTQSHIEDLFPGHKCLILSDGITLTAVPGQTKET